MGRPSRCTRDPGTVQKTAHTETPKPQIESAMAEPREHPKWEEWTTLNSNAKAGLRSKHRRHKITPREFTVLLPCSQAPPGNTRTGGSASAKRRRLDLRTSPGESVSGSLVMRRGRASGTHGPEA